MLSRRFRRSRDNNAIAARSMIDRARCHVPCMHVNFFSFRLRESQISVRRTTYALATCAGFESFRALAISRWSMAGRLFLSLIFLWLTGENVRVCLTAKIIWLTGSPNAKHIAVNQVDLICRLANRPRYVDCFFGVSTNFWLDPMLPSYMWWCISS